LCQLQTELAPDEGQNGQIDQLQRAVQHDDVQNGQIDLLQGFAKYNQRSIQQRLTTKSENDQAVQQNVAVFGEG